MSEILDVGIAKGLLTTRGDIIVRSATAPIRLALGGKGKLLGSDGTDAVYVASVHSVNDFRLTLTSGTSVTTSDVTGATTMYLTPHVGNNIGLYDGTQWKVFQTAEISLALGTLTNALPYDVFAYDNAGTVTLEFTAWTNGTTRATALVRQDGVWSKTGALTRRYVGTFYTTATTTTEDSLAKRFLWNANNRVDRKLISENATGHTYVTDTWRAFNGTADSTTQSYFVIGLSEDIISFWGWSDISPGTDVGVSCSLDSGSAPANATYFSPATSNWELQGATNISYPGIGYHYLQTVENGGASSTFNYGRHIGVIKA